MEIYNLYRCFIVTEVSEFNRRTCRHWQGRWPWGPRWWVS